MKALQFHRITPRFQYCGTWNKPGQFERFLDVLRKKNVDIVLPGEAKHGIVLTFDDGERSVYDYAYPILKRYMVKAVVFLVVDYIGKMNRWDIRLAGAHNEHLSWDQISEMKAYGIEFGSHTMSHRNLTRLHPGLIEYELRESKRTIEKKLGLCRCISYPFNRVDATVHKIVQKTGYEFGFGGDGGDQLLLKKEAMYITDTVKSLEVKILERPGLWYRYERFKQKVINYFTIATMISALK